MHQWLSLLWKVKKNNTAGPKIQLGGVCNYVRSDYLQILCSDHSEAAAIELMGISLLFFLPHIQGQREQRQWVHLHRGFPPLLSSPQSSPGDSWKRRFSTRSPPRTFGNAWRHFGLSQWGMGVLQASDRWKLRMLQTSYKAQEYSPQQVPIMLKLRNPALKHYLYHVLLLLKSLPWLSIKLRTTFSSSWKVHVYK